eukprot:2271057-Prymnesium_polylepis.1
MPLSSAGQRVDAAAEGGRCSRESSAWAMCDGWPNTVRAQWRIGSPSDVARWAGGLDPAAPGVDD